MKRLLTLAVILLATVAASAEPDKSPDSTAHVPLTIQARLQPDQLSDLDKALADAGDNVSQLTAALDMLEGSLFDDAVFLIANMPHLDRLEMTRDVLVHHVVYADLARRIFPWQVPDSLYRQFILTYRLDQEPISDWRASFWPMVKARASKSCTTEEFARQINAWVFDTVHEQEAEFFGGLQTPDQTLATLRGSRKEIASLTTALLKTAGIPSRKVFVASMLGQPGGVQWTEIFLPEKGKWLPLYPDAPQRFGDFSRWEPDSLKSNVSYAIARSAFEILDVTGDYTETGDLDLHFTRGGAPAADYEGFTLNVFNQGAFMALDELGSQADSNGDFHCRLGEGRYWIIAGTRDLTGSPFVRMLSVELRPGMPAKLVMDLTPALYVSSSPETLQTAVDVPLFTLTDATGQARSSRESVGQGPLLLVLLRPDHEPSTRTKDLVQFWLDKHGGKAPAVLWIIEGERGPGGPVNAAWDPEGRIGQVFGLKSQDDYPLVLWVDKEGRIALTSKGYNLNIAGMLDNSIPPSP